MCQARRDGGRRCPIHRHDSIAAINVALATTELTREQVENTFRELTREGRGTQDPTQEQWDRFKETALNEIPDEHRSTVQRNIEKANQHLSMPDGKTFYAMTKVADRAKKRDENLAALMERVSKEKGYTQDEVKQEFKRAYRAAYSEYGQGQPEGYTQSAYAWAKNQSLPYDTQSVVAIQALRSLVARTVPVNRVLRFPTGNEVITEIGYASEGGRLEVKLGANDQVLGYQNVSVEDYEKMVQGNQLTQNALSVFNEVIRNNPDYRYENVEVSATDSQPVQCANCGQFTSPLSHACPGGAGNTLGDVTDSESVSPESVEKQPASDPTDEPAASEVPESREAHEEPSSDAVVYDPAKPQQMFDAENAPSSHRLVSVNLNDVEFRPLEPGETEESFGLVGTRIVNRSLYYLTHEENDRFYVEESLRYEPEWAVRIADILRSGQEVELIYAKREYTTNTIANRRKTDYAIVQVLGVPPLGSSQKGFKAVKTTRDPNATLTISMIDPDAKAYHLDISGEVYNRENMIAAIRKSQSEQDVAPTLRKKQSVTKDIILDARASERYTLRIPKLNEMRRAIKEHDSFHMDISVENIAYGKSHVDDQGYLVNDTHTQVSGTVKFSKGSDGQWKSVTNQHLLQCECSDYAKYYNCQHVNMVMRKADNILAQSGALDSTVRSSANRIDLRSMDNGQYLNAALARRNDMTVTPPNEETGERLRYTFSQIEESRASLGRIRNWYSNLALNVYQDPLPEVNSFQEYLEFQRLARARQRNLSFSTIASPRIVQQALGRGGIVDVPVKAQWALNSYHMRYDVEGTVSLVNNDNGEVAVHGHTLKCPCSEYAENYDCVHVRATIAHSYHLPYIGSREHNPEPMRTHGSGLHALAPIPGLSSAEEESYYSLSVLHRRYPDMSESELREQLVIERARQAEEARLEQLAVDEHRRVRDEQNRERYERQAREERDHVQKYLKDNRNYSKSLKSFREHLVEKYDNPESSYTEDRAKIDTAIKLALERKHKGLDAVPFRPAGGVLAGSGEGLAGRKFGVELEFQIDPKVNTDDALEKIGKELHEAGLTTSKNQQYYHSAVENGYHAWSFENDCTVDGELVSPILEDTPESWEQLRLATEILKRNGAVATVKAGSHVHVSSGSYEANLAKSAELVRLNKDYEDITYRLSTSPQRGKHRGTNYCEPNIKDSAKDIDRHDLFVWNKLNGHGHGMALNIQGGRETELHKAHVEFRTWDATLDPGIIQAQVMMSVAMTDRAEYNVLKTGKSLERTGEDRTVGSHREQGVDKLETHTERGIAEYLDTMFTRDEDKDHIAALFAVTTWQTRDG